MAKRSFRLLSCLAGLTLITSHSFNTTTAKPATALMTTNALISAPDYQWYKECNDSCAGINLPAAMKYLQSRNLKPRRTVVVGIIDSGVDTTAVDVIPSLWVNPKERRDGKDNDGNGYIDDIHGWNFLGTSDGSFNMTSAGTEEYREFKRLFPKYKDIDTTAIADPAEYKYYMNMRKKAGIDSYLNFFIYAGLKQEAYEYIDAALSKLYTPAQLDTITIGTLTHTLETDDQKLIESFQGIGIDLLKAGDEATWKSALKEQNDSYALMAKRINGIENDADKRLLMGDNIKNPADIHYGNSNLNVDGFDHGTFVASVIAGQGVIEPGMTGIFPPAKLMIIRAVPEGDEYDKDVATSIRYAVDNGASVINMSLGKMTSPDSLMVNEAIAYALSKDVLILQAAGNSSLDIDTRGYYPTATDSEGNIYSNFIRVGASDRNGNRGSVSNYGRNKVDLFAPGVDLRGNDYASHISTASGTSLATPVAAGVAAMLRAYFPELSASQIKDILVKSCRKTPGLASTCRSEGVIDVFQAVQLAEAATPSYPEISADWVRTERFSADSLQQLMRGTSMNPTWIEGTPNYYYSTKKDGLSRYYIVDAATGKRRILIKDPVKFAREYTKLSGDTMKPDDISLYGIDFKKNNFNQFSFKKKGKTFRYDTRTGTLSLVKNPKEAASKGRTLRFGKDHTNADSTITMMGSGYDLYFRDNRTGIITRLTDDGKEDASHTYRNKPDTLDNNVSGWWIGNRFVQPLYDSSEILETGFIETVGQKRPKVNKFRMPMPGDSGVKQTRLYWFNPESGEGRYLPIEKYPDQVVDFNYHNTPDMLYFTRRSRGADHIDLCRIDMPEGKVTEIISEECLPNMNMTLFNYRVVEDGKKIIWWSERTGKGNYYLYDSNGHELNRITQGDNLVAGQIVKLDSLTNSMIFIGYGNEPDVSPYYELYYSAKLDGSGQRLLTPGNANHKLQINEGRREAVDIFSRIDLPPVMATLHLDRPSSYTVVDSIDATPLRKAGWRPPVRFNVKAADGITDLPGIMYVPFNLDPSKKYPIITNVYPGPQDDQIPQDFVIDDNYNQSLAELGFIVITAPSRGSSPLRGRDFYTFGHGNFRDYPLADDHNTIEQLAARYPFIDLDRVGIYGHSGGGFQTVAAMLNHPDFYKVGVAASGNHDNNIYIQNWGEIFHGIEESTDSVTGKTIFKAEIPTNQELAANLNGRLLLITGDVDKNVSPSHTYRLADALIKEGKRFDMFILPGKDHGVMCPYYYNLIRYYFVDHLLNPMPYHQDIIRHQ